jgi:hypothetical protein
LRSFRTPDVPRLPPESGHPIWRLLGLRRFEAAPSEWQALKPDACAHPLVDGEPVRYENNYPARWIFVEERGAPITPLSPK